VELDEVALRLFAAWLEGQNGSGLTDWQPVGEGLYSAGSAERDLTIAISPLFEREYGDWSRQKELLEEQLAAALENGAYVLWLPPGAALPLEEPARTELVFRLKMRAAALQTGERVDFRMPVALAIQKQEPEGAYASVIGGLSPIWSWFTEKIRGVYSIDARGLTRLPDAREEREAMVEAIAAELSTMEVGERKQLPAEDSWTLQRVTGSSGFSIVGAPFDRLPEERETRKRVRAVLSSAHESLSGEALKVLLMPGLYLYASEENVSTAIRGFDPVLYAGIDYVALIADGIVKPIIAPPRQAASR
jgi:hypothetical protein